MHNTIEFPFRVSLNTLALSMQATATLIEKDNEIIATYFFETENRLAEFKEILLFISTDEKYRNIFDEMEFKTQDAHENLADIFEHVFMRIENVSVVLQ